MHQRITVGKFASLTNPNGPSLWQPCLTYLQILWQKEVKNHPKTNRTQEMQQPGFPETPRFVFQCTMDDEPQKFWQQQKGTTTNCHLLEHSSFKAHFHLKEGNG